MECDICGSTTHFRRECPKGDGKGRSAPSAHLAQTDDEVQHVDLEAFYAADATTPVYFMTMRYMDAAGLLTGYAEDLYEAFCTDGDENDFEEWLGLPALIDYEEWDGLPPDAGQPAITNEVEVDNTAGQPATTIGAGYEEYYIGDDDDTIPATEEELHQALGDVTPQTIGNATDLPQDQQYLCGINDGHHSIFMIRAWPRDEEDAGQPADQRPQHAERRQRSWRRVNRAEDDHGEWPVVDPPRRSHSRRGNLRERSSSIIRRPAWRREASRGPRAEEDPDVDPQTGDRYVT